MLHPWLFSGRQIISSIAQTPTMKSAAERLIKRQRVFFSFDLCFQNTAMAIAFPTMITKHSTAKANVHRITSTARSSAISLDVSTRGKIALFSFMTPILSSSILQLVTVTGLIFATKLNHAKLQSTCFCFRTIFMLITNSSF